MKIKTELAIKRFSQAVLDDNAAVFVGAGLSIPSGFVSWSQLLQELAEELSIDTSSFTDLPTLAQYHVNETGNRGGVNQVLVEEFVRQTEESPSHRLISKMPIRTIWTTNYDCLLEQALQNESKVVEINRRPEDLTTTVRNRDATVYKMHGDMTELHRGVLTRDDYEQYDRERGLFRSALEGDLVQKTFLFVGFSFDDPNINFVLSRTRVTLGASQREHFYLLRAVSRDDFGEGDYESKEECEAAFGYAKALQDLRVRDLSRYGIRTVLMDSYTEVETFFRRVEQRYRRHSVFISGAAVDYSPFDEDSARTLIRQLAGELVAKNFRVVNGYGLGVGPAVIYGVLERTKDTGLPLDRSLLSRPFPIFAKEEDRAQKNEANRREMLRESGLAIFIFGNKLDDNGELINSPGVRDEFKMATELGIPCIGIGATGGMSAEIADEIIDALSKKQKDDEPTAITELRLEGMLEKLKAVNTERDDISQLVTDIVAIVVELRG